MLELLNNPISTCSQKVRRVPSFNKAFIRHYRDLDQNAIEANAAERPLRRHFYKDLGTTGFSDATTAASTERLGDTIDRMDRALADREWLNGDSLTLADYCVVPTIDRMNNLGMAHFWDGKQNFLRWWSAVQARPAYQATYYPGTRVSDIYTDLKERT